MLLSRNKTLAGTRRLSPPGLRVYRVGYARKLSALAALHLLFFGCVCLAQVQSLGAAPPTGPFAGAIISEWRGRVRVQLPTASPSTPKRGQTLPAGTVVETGDGRLVLVLRTDESEIVVRPHSRLLITEPAPSNWTAISIFLGRVRAYINKRTGGMPPFQMSTPSAVIAVRGTRFDVEVDKHGTSEIDVFDGLVEVASSAVAGPSVLVSPGFSTRVGVGTLPEPPVPTVAIRPDVEAPDGMAKQEFAREQSQSNRALQNELGERPDRELNESLDETRESETEQH